MTDNQRKIKVLVVDDSALMRKMIPMIISADEDIEVIGTAMDGDFAISKIPSLMPDVITLDVDMPRMDGLTTLKTIVRDFGIPVILVSSLTKDGAEITLKGLEMGAFDFVPKPKEAISVHISDISGRLIEKIKAAASCRPMKFKELTFAKNKVRPVSLFSNSISSQNIVAIGISTGGPQALTEILPQFNETFPCGILIVQHMPEGFTDLFAQRLDSLCNIRVREAADGDVIGPGKALIAPGGRHMTVRKTTCGAVTVLSKSALISGHMPSVDVLFTSVAEEYGRDAIALIMTGMGCDGVEGLKKIKESGGTTLAQDEDTSVIYGMPKAAVESSCVDMVLGLHEIVPAIAKLADLKETKVGSKAGCCPYARRGSGGYYG